MADNTATFKIEIEVDPGNAAATVGNLTGELRKMTGLDGQADKIDKAFQRVENSSKKTTQSLSTTRYALYDVSQTLGVAGTAMLGLAAVTSGTAIAFERDFANVIRTVGSEIGYANPLIDELRDNLVKMSTEIPVTFRGLTEIATLGGQLGIAATGIDEFTEVVAKLGATTDLSFEQAGTAIGRFAAILAVPEEEFENLASAILKVGVNSVATESQIVNISTQISSMAAYAGLTAEQVVGLAGALASVGAQPELSRGTITRTFTEMSEAITEGGDRLDSFAKIAGVSSDEFRASFGTSRFASVFQSFIGGLGDMQKNGEDANAAIRQLGITSVRDVPLLLRLGLAQETVNAAFADSATGYRDGTELNAQYGVIAETTASKLQVLANSFQALFDAVGSNALGPLGDALDVLTGFVGMLTDIASNDFAGPFLGLGVVLVAFAGAITLAGAALAAFGASSIAIRQGLMGIVAIAPGASAAILGTGTASAIAAGEMRAATIGAKAFGFALKALSLVGLVLVLPDIANFFDDGIRGIQGLTNEFEDMQKRFLDTDLFFGADITQMDASFNAAGRALGDIANRGFGDIRRMDEELAALASSGSVTQVREQYEALRDVFLERGGSLDAFESLFTDTKAALSGTGAVASEAAAGLDEIAAAAQQAEADLEALRDAILQFGATSISVEATQIALSDAWNKMTEAASAADVTITGTNENSLKYRSTLLEIDKAARDASIALIENGGSAEQATEKYEEGRRALIDSIAAKTGDMEAARLWADQVLGTSGEAAFAIAQYAAAYNQVPKEVRTTIYADPGPAYGEVARLISNINGQVAWVTVRATDETGNIVNRGGINGNGSRDVYASGGHVTGPGTGTSDSIPAWLSNGEYVIKASSVQKYGTSFMNAINAGRAPRFASGGQVGSSAPSMMGGVVELGPKSLARLSREVVNRISIDQRSIANAANAGNAQNSWKGGLG